MPAITRQNFLEPFVVLLREGTLQDPYVDITETIQLVPTLNMDAGVYNIAVLRELPLLTQGVVATINGVQLTEIRDSLTEIDANHFKVDYTNGRVYLSQDYINSEVTFAYKGRGVILLNSERIVLSYGGSIENLYTLDQYVQEHMGEVNIGDLSLLKTEAKDKIVNSINEVYDMTSNHAIRTDNPHSVTKAQVGLGNVNNTSDMNKPVSTLQQQALDNLNTSIRTDMDSEDDFLQQQIDALVGAYIYIGTINLNTADITQLALTTRAQEIMQTPALQTGWVLLDNEKHEWYYNGATTTWIDMEQSNVYPATNTTLGLVKGNSNVSIIDGLMTVLLAQDSSKLGGQLPSYYGTATDVTNKVNKSGDTMTGKLNLPDGTTDSAPINVGHGVAPDSPTNGDIWMTTAGTYVRRNGTTRTLYDSTNAATANLSTVSQSEAEAGTATIVRGWTAQRIRQAIDARAWTSDTLVPSYVEPSPIVGKTILWIDMN